MLNVFFFHAEEEEKDLLDNIALGFLSILLKIKSLRLRVLKYLW